MNYCNNVSKQLNILESGCKSTNHETVIPLTITTDMLPLSISDKEPNTHCGSFNPIVGKSSDFIYNASDITLTRMKSIDSAVCSMFTPASSLQLSPSSQIGSNYAIYDSTGSSNATADSGINTESSNYIDVHLNAQNNQSKSRFLTEIDSQLTTNNIAICQSTQSNISAAINMGDSGTIVGSSHNYHDYNRDYNSPDGSLMINNHYLINKSSVNSENVLLWQNNTFRYDNTEKEERGNGLSGNNWPYEDSGSVGSFNSQLTALNQLFAGTPSKRPITGGHNSQQTLNSQFVRAPVAQPQQQNLPWNCYNNNSSGSVIGAAASCSNGKFTMNSLSSNNPWNQALVNQRMGLAPAPVNSMNLSSYPQKLGNNNNNSNSSSNCGSKKHNLTQRNLLHSPQNTISNNINSNNGIVSSKQSFNGVSYSKSPNFDLASPSQNLNLNAAGDGSIYDSLSGNNFNYLEKIASNDNMKINFDNHLFDVLRSLDSKTINMSLDDPVNIVPSDQYNSNVFKNINPLLFPAMSQREERFSRKVFVGGLPPDIDEEEITAAFKRFGALVVDWPHKAESKSYFPPKGYCFLLFQEEISVQNLIDACIMDENKYYWCVSSPTIKDKPVQIRPWSLADSDFVMDGSEPLDPRKTIFVGGVPRPLRAVELAMIMDRLYGGVCYSGIDTDPELKYPKGAGRVAFSNQQSYIAAISARFVQLQHHDIDKRVEVKPYVLDDQMCDECQGSRCCGKFAPFFCANVTCLQYYCEQCWAQIHSRQGREYHKPLVKEGADRPRTVPFRW